MSLASALPTRSVRWIAGILRVKTHPLAEAHFAKYDARESVEVPFFGATLPLEVRRSTTHRLLAIEGERFIGELPILRRLVAPGDTVFDIGANIGYYALLLRSLVGERGRVVCLEPEPQNFAQLVRVVEANRFLNVEVMNVAASHGAGRVSIDEGLNGRVSADESTSSTIEALPLDALIDRRPNFVKVDVEGYEGQVLLGMRQIMEQLAPALFVEVHPVLLTYGISARDVVVLVRSHYERVEAWEPRKSTSGIVRLARRYRAASAVGRIEDLEGLLAACDEGRRSEPFWICSDARR